MASKTCEPHQPKVGAIFFHNVLPFPASLLLTNRWWGNKASFSHEPCSVHAGRQRSPDVSRAPLLSTLTSHLRWKKAPWNMHHLSNIYCMAKLLLVSEGLIYSSERMPRHCLAVYKSFGPTNTVWKTLIVVPVYFILHGLLGGCDILSPLGWTVCENVSRK